MWKPLGQILVSQGAITDSQLNYALEIQLNSPDPMRLGDVLVSMGLITHEQVEAALAEQGSATAAK